MAAECALKFKETCRLQAEAFSSAEFLHGPIVLVRSGFSVLALGQQDAALQSTLEACERIAQMGARVWFACADRPGQRVKTPEGCQRLPLPDSLHPLVDPLFSAQAFYREVVDLAIARGCDPDRPSHLTKVTETH